MNIVTYPILYFPKKVKALSTNVNKHNFKEDYNRIIKRIGIENSNINKFRFVFDSNTGSISQYQFQLISSEHNNPRSYDVIYYSDLKTYSISKNKKLSVTNNNNVEGKRLFTVLDEFTYKDILISKKSKHNYILTAPEDYIKGTYKGNLKYYLIQNDKINKVDKDISYSNAHIIKLQGDSDLIAIYILN